MLVCIYFWRACIRIAVLAHEFSLQYLWLYSNKERPRKCNVPENIGWCFEEPKRPPSVFFLYSSEAMERHGRQLTREELIQIQQDRKNMDSTSKAAIIQRAEELKLDYERKRQDFQTHGRCR